MPNGLDPELLRNLEQTFLDCDYFFDDAKRLKSLFVSSPINLWRSRLPEASNIGDRILLTIEYLYSRSNLQGQNALALFVKVLRDRYDKDEECHYKLQKVLDALVNHLNRIDAPSVTDTPELSEANPNATAHIFQVTDLSNKKPIETVAINIDNNVFDNLRSQLQAEQFGVDYTPLDALLKAKRWKEADLETSRLLLKIADREENGWLRTQDMKTFSCSDLQTIDALWTIHSDVRLGFRVQREIWRVVVRQPGKFNLKNFEKFGNYVGWRIDGEWLRAYDDFDTTADPPIGHLPSLRLPAFEHDMDWWGSWRDAFKGFLSRLEVCLAQ